MGRKKNEVQPYDFSDFEFTREDVVRSKYHKDGDIINAIRTSYNASNDYYVKSALEKYDADPATFTFKKTLYRWVRTAVISHAYENHCGTERADLEKRFAEWFKSREDAQEVWKHYIPTPPDGRTLTIRNEQGAIYSNATWYLRNGQGKPLADIVDGPPDYASWVSFLADYDVSQHIELARSPCYEVGDLILLRAPFVGNYRHDPMYGQDVTIPRLGTIMEYKEELYRGGRRGNKRGNRSVNVLWMNTSDIRKIGEKFIKLECRKGRNVKVVK